MRTRSRAAIMSAALLLLAGCSSGPEDGLPEGVALVSGVQVNPPEVRLDFMRRPHAVRGQAATALVARLRPGQNVRVRYQRQRLHQGIDRITIVEVMPK